MIKKICALWRKEETTDETNNALYDLTKNAVDFGFNEKVMPAGDKLSDEDAVEINKFFFIFYQKATEKDYKETGTLKATKIAPYQKDLIEAKGIGMLHRACFTTERKKKKDAGED